MGLRVAGQKRGGLGQSILFSFDVSAARRFICRALDVGCFSGGAVVGWRREPTSFVLTLPAYFPKINDSSIVFICIFAQIFATLMLST